MCFSLGWFEQILIWLVVVCAVIALLRLIIGFVLPRLGFGAEILSLIIRVITIVIWAIVLIAVIVFVFDMIACLVPALSFPRVR